MRYFYQHDLADKLYARSNAKRLQRLESMSIAILSEFVQTYQTALALSFGKDSMTIAQILKNADILTILPLVMYNHSGVETEDTEAMRDHVCETWQLQNFQETRPDDEVLRKTVAQFDFSATHYGRDFVYECLEKPRWRMMDKFNITGCLLGLRKAESNARSINFAMRGENYYAKREKNQILTPIVNWTTQDVYGYLAYHDTPIHPVYAKLAKLGLPRDRLRHNTPLSLAFVQNGEISLLKRLYPKTFRAFCELYPSAANFT